MSTLSFRQRLAQTRSLSQILENYRQTFQVHKLQIGTGTNILKGWFNTDLSPSSPECYYLDATKRFPFEDQIFDYVFSEHQIEHIPYIAGLNMLRECFRILKPGGKIRIATPDLERLLRLYSPPLDAIQQRYLQFITERFVPEGDPTNPAFVINNAFRNWGHQFLYDRATLQGAMEQCGFAEIVPVQPGESSHEHLQGLEGHGHFIGDEEINRFETFILEGTRI